MPFKSFLADGRYCVFSLDDEGNKTGSSRGCHDTQDEANAQVAALNINVDEKDDFSLPLAFDDEVTSCLQSVAPDFGRAPEGQTSVCTTCLWNKEGLTCELYSCVFALGDVCVSWAIRPRDAELEAARARQGQADNEPVEEKAIARHRTPTNKTAPWNGPKATADAPNDAAVLRYMHAWVDSESSGNELNEKASYKLPHHAPRQGSPAIIRGVNNALARLSSTNVPEGDRSGIEAHLRGHRRDAGLEEHMGETELTAAVNTVALQEQMSKEEKVSLLEIVTTQENEVKTMEEDRQAELAGLQAQIDTMKKVMKNLQPSNEGLVKETKLTEAKAGHIIKLEEGENGRSPHILFYPITKGWGNKETNHYYSKELCIETAPKFVGAKMYATDHKQSEKNVLNQVSEVVESPAGHDAAGIPYARAVILSAEFEDHLRRRQRAGILGNLHNSIFAGGEVEEETFKESERTGHRVVSIFGEDDGAHIDIDWVTRGGIKGAAAFALTESEAGMSDKEKDNLEESEPKTKAALLAENADVMLTKKEVDKLLPQNLHASIAERIKAGGYKDETAVTEALNTEIQYYKKLTGDGKPVQFGEVDPVDTTVNIAEIDKETTELMEGVLKKYVPRYKGA